MEYIVKYLGVEVGCDTPTAALNLIHEIKNGSKARLTSSRKPGTGKQSVESTITRSIRGTSQKFFNLLITKGTVSEAALRHAFGFENNQQLAGVVSGAKSALQRSGFDPSQVLIRTKTNAGEDSYMIATDSLEDIKAAI